MIIENNEICSLKYEDQEGSMGHKATIKITQEKLKRVLDSE